ncbi:MAG: 2-oxoacid:ferredoxin oxidoreductase subunit beta [Candidatus Bipolaricaulia bacterium]
MLEQYLRKGQFPFLWCPGCGNGTVTMGLLQAIDELGLEKDRVAVISGIGCSSRVVFYLDFNTMHTTHGRAIAFATGVKLVKPELTVILAMGDGDAVAIGGNHFIHAARRNIDLTVIVYNNDNYGMTGGQVGPTTEEGARTTTTLYGNIERPLDVVKLALAAGATYVARTTTYDFEELPRFIKRAIAHKGFSVVDVLTQCPTFYGRLNRLGDSYAMAHRFKRITVPIEEAEGMSPEDLEGKMITGEFRCEERPEFVESYLELVRRAREGEGVHA